VTASEFAFLAIGLVLGIATGAAIVEVLRARPPTPREVRVTMTPDSVPRRAMTLASAAFAETPEPAVGGPAEPVGATGPSARPQPGALLPAADALEPEARRKPFVLEPRPLPRRVPVAIPVGPEPGPSRSGPRPTGMLAALSAAQARAARVLGAGSARAPVPQTRATPGTASDAAARTMSRPPVAVAEPPAGRAGDARAAGEGRPAGEAGQAGEAGTLPAVDDSPCGEVRRVADERCTLASTAAERAAATAAALHDLQRIYDEHQARADRAAAAGDPVRIRSAKEAARQAFRRARDAARSRAELEEAARAWLAEINAINGTTRGAADSAVREREAAIELVPRLERLAVEADAARIAAERAEEACIAAREAAADCDEAATRASAPAAPPAVSDTPRPTEPGRARRTWDNPDEADGIAAAIVGGQPLVVTLLRGDRAALAHAASVLGGDDAAARRTWTLELGRFLEAIVDRAIEAASLDFPTDHPFWGAFSLAQNREIAAALASLGYRFDGLGGWLDGRVPSQRDLSLAVGYAGLDPMRVRRWPTESEAAELYRDVRVAADEYLVAAAGGFTLGELVSLLGRRADALTEIWNAWGRVRPMLLEPSA
jgi:hypothetical protein